MDARDQPRTRAIAFVVLQQEFPGFLIQGGFWIRIDQQTLYCHEYMTDAKGRLPILLQSANANLASGGDVWVKDLGRKPTCRDSSASWLRVRTSALDLHLGGAAGNSLVKLNLTLK